MGVVRRDRRNQLQAYNVMCQQMKMGAEIKTPFEVTWCEIPPLGSTFKHAHHGFEMFVVTVGTVLIEVNGDLQQLNAGDVLGVQPFTAHKLFNQSRTETVTLCAIYSAHPPQTCRGDKVCIISPPPTTNGPLHIGHIAGPFLAANILERYLRLNKIPVMHMGGTDDHQTYIPYQAQLDGVSAQELSLTYTRSITEAFAMCQLSFDRYLSSRADGLFHQFALTVFEDLVKAGIFTQKTMESLSCQGCDKVLSEAELAGNCPTCHAEMCGFTCEQCSWVVGLHRGLLNPVCRYCGQAAEKQETKEYVFQLEQYVPELQSIHSEMWMNAKLNAFQQQIFQTTIPDLAVSGPGEWGLTSHRMRKGQVITPWFELFARYLYLHEDGVDTVWFFGVDNIFHYTIFLPALFIASGQAKKMPKYLMSSDFYLLANEKFSTSRNHAIWVQDLLQEYQADPVRFYLSLTRPEGFTSNFMMDEFKRFCDDVLAQKLGGWVTLLNAKLASVKKNPLPLATTLEDTHAKRLFEALQRYLYQAEEYYHFEKFSPKKVATLLVQLLEEAYYYSQYMSHLSLELTALKCFAIVVTPIMPAYGAQLLQALQGDEAHWESELSLITQRPNTLPHLSIYCHHEKNAHA